MGDSCSKTCCTKKDGMNFEDLNLNLSSEESARWQHIERERSLKTDEVTISQLGIEEMYKEGLDIHEHRPAEKYAIRVKTLNKISQKAEKIIKGMDEFSFHGKRPNNPVLGPYLYKKDRSTYHGQYRQGVRQGLGKCVWRDGSFYNGQWSLDLKQGKGRLVTSRGDVYEGDFAQGKREGTGKLTMANNKAVYSGGWMEGKMHGTGIMTFGNGGKYVGSFEDGKMSGPGIYSKDKDRYKTRGTWRGGVKQGKFVTELKGKKYFEFYEDGKLVKTKNEGEEEDNEKTRI